ncbi:thiamine ABC transporter permease [Trabulsiella odontotermitis]|uniref:thiamine ABC transporter permease n=1 Tax=Trabulsiella odontotermitis TaxID=379893 RepID=UPI0024B850AF|nr:thiamine ABC transporter permease [Trabulsiella odontotermitis]WHP33230.1 thiamine ABC transporter permease [Trabulsiella odontotermitis]
MATPLRYALTLLVVGAIVVIYAPLLPALRLMTEPALSLRHWQVLFADPQLWQALAATLVSTGIAVFGALALALTAIAVCWPGNGWQTLVSRLPLLLAVPHVAFAASALLLFAEGGWLFQICHVCTPMVDRYGIGLGLALAVKESGFILWAMYGVLGETRLAQQTLVLKSQGYSHWQCLWYLILPAIAPALGLVLVATAAWTLSAVDVALILGPGNPPTLAVLAWTWLSQGDPSQQAKGALACLILLLLLATLVLSGWGFWRLWQRRVPDFRGRRHQNRMVWPGRGLTALLPFSGLLCALVLLLLAQFHLPTSDSLMNSLALATLTALTGAVLCLLWLEWGLARLTPLLWLPLLLPALPLVAGQYRLALNAWLDGTFLAVFWGHLLWVIPWMLFVLRPAWQRIDPRLLLIARTLGWQQGRIFLWIKCPLLLRPLLAALAIGFSVSIAQYLPSLWLGAGRVPTLTTDAVAQSSGGDMHLLALLSLWQLLLPALIFALTALLARWLGHYRQGLR